MVNQEDLVDIQLGGRGIVFKPNGRYQPGEYSDLVNIDLSSSGSLINRPPALGFRRKWGLDNSPPTHILGNYGNGQIVSDANAQIGWAVGSNLHIPSNTSYLAVDGSTGVTGPQWVAAVIVYTYRGSVGAFVELTEWNKIDHFAVTWSKWWEYGEFVYLQGYVEFADDTSAGDVIGTTFITRADRASFHNSLTAPFGGGWGGPLFQMLQALRSNAGVTAEFLDSETWDYSATPITDYWDPPTDIGYRTTQGGSVTEYRTVGGFIFKDRWWFATRNTVYFSAVADPLNYIPPDGGFFRFPNEGITSIISLGDLIYVFNSAGIYIISYDTDPNLDSQIFQISAFDGALDSCILNDVVYFCSFNALYRITGTNIEKVSDLDYPVRVPTTDRLRVLGGAYLESGHNPKMEIESLNGQLYILYYRLISNFNKAKTPNTWLRASLGLVFNAPEYPAENLPLKHFFHMDPDSGFSSAYEFPTMGMVLQVAPCAELDKALGSRLGIVTTQSPTDTLAAQHYANIMVSRWTYYPNNDNNEYNTMVAGNILDHIEGALDIYPNAFFTGWETSTISMALRIPHFSAEELDFYNFKKFRSIEMDVNVPTYVPSGGNVNAPNSALTMSIQAGLGHSDPASNVPNGLLTRTLDSQLPPLFYDYPAGGSYERAVNGSIPEVLRFGVNQRAKTLGLALKHTSVALGAVTTNNVQPPASQYASAVSMLFELNRLTLLLSNTKRGPINDSSSRA